MGWYTYYNFAVQVYLPSRRSWRGTYHTQLEDQKSRLSTELFLDYRTFFGEDEWHRIHGSDGPVENYPLYVGDPDDEYYDTFGGGEGKTHSTPHDNPYDWMTDRIGDVLVISPRLMVPSWDDYLFRIKEEQGKSESGDDDFFAGLEYGDRLKYDHYPCLVQFAEVAKATLYTPLREIVAKEPTDTESLRDVDSFAPWQSLRAKRIRVYESCLRVLLRQFDYGVISIIAEFAPPRLNQVRIHFSEASDL